MTRCLHIDGSFLAYSRFKANKCEPPALVARVMRKLDDLRLSYSPQQTIVSWDTASGTMKRRQLHPDYKKGRQEKEPEYICGFLALQGELHAQGITQAKSPTGEGDDVIATLVRTTPGPHVIYSADKDLLQLVAPGVVMVKAPGSRGGCDKEITHKTLPTDRIKLGSTWVEGLDASGWGDLLALAGDPGDHVPGIPGIGPVLAVQLLEACPGFVPLVLNEADDTARSWVAAANPRLVKYAIRCCAKREELRISKELVTLQTLDDLEVW